MAKKKAKKKAVKGTREEVKFDAQTQVSVSTGGLSRSGVAKLNSQTPQGKTGEVTAFPLMMRDPTITLATNIIVAMMMRQPWSVVTNDDKHEQFAADLLRSLEPHKGTIIRSAFRGLLMDGWRSFEVAYAADQSALIGVKPLRNENTEPLVYEDTGLFAGVLNKGSGLVQEEVDIDEQHCILVNFDDDGFGDIGEPLLRLAYSAYKKWEDCDEGARRYDQKMAGGFLLVQYPPGASPYASAGSGAAGTQTANNLVAAQMAESFMSVGYACVPRNVDPDTGEPLPATWTVEHISAGGGMQDGFISREKYLDALKLRAFGIPERSATEGTFGTKAEAEAHADIAFIVNSDRHNRIAECVDATVVQTLCEANTGERDCCKLVVGKLDPADRELFSAIFTSLMTDPVFGEQIAGRVDVDTLLEKLNIPVRLDAANEALTPGQPNLEQEALDPAEETLDETDEEVL